MIKILNKSIITLIGAEDSGKTTWSQAASAQLENQGYNVRVLSSELIRKCLLFPHENLDKKSIEMMAVSEQAFSLLFSSLEALIQYPVNSDVVFLDTSGFAKEFRDQVNALAEKYCYSSYAVVFDYAEYGDNFAFTSDNYAKGDIRKQVERIKNAFISKELKSSDFTTLYRIKSRDFSKYSVEIEETPHKVLHIEDSNATNIFIGDIHTCVNELKELLIQCGISFIDDIMEIPENTNLIFIGDLIDKGTQTREIVEFMHKNKGKYSLILGNHENSIMKLLKNSGKKDETQIAKYYNSYHDLNNDEQLKAQFTEIYDASYAYGYGKNFVATHAPTRVKYLNKTSPRAIKHLFSTFTGDLKKDDSFIDSLYKKLSHLVEEANQYHPFHIFGHNSFTEVFRYKNKIGIDTGSVYGNKLSGVIVYPSRKIKIVSVKSKHAQSTDFLFPPDLFLEKSGVEQKKSSSYQPLNLENSYRIKKLVRDKVNYISGTMSPADKTDVQLESLEKAIEYYKNRVKSVVLQPKYMGSRCQMYIHRVVSKSYAVSRNGFKINQVDLTSVFENLRNNTHLKQVFESELTMNTIILDGELLPWSTLGKGLIDHEFAPYGSLIQKEIEFLKESNFDQQYRKVLEHIESSTQFKQEVNSLSKNEMLKKYSHAQYGTFSNALEIQNSIIATQKLEEYYEQYKSQEGLFYEEKSPYYMPFMILKKIYDDGNEICFFQDENLRDMKLNFELLNNDRIVCLDFEEKTLEECIKVAQEFYDYYVDEKNFEGIVIKPRYFSEKSIDIAPYLKVRNSKYLTFVYGFDYQHEQKYSKLVRKKSIRKKVELSIAEWNNGIQLLSIPYTQIDTSNKDYYAIASKLVDNLELEKNLDPRL